MTSPRYYLVRDDGAKITELFLSEGIGNSPLDANSDQNSKLAHFVNSCLEQEIKGGVSFAQFRANKLST